MEKRRFGQSLRLYYMAYKKNDWACLSGTSQDAESSKTEQAGHLGAEGKARLHSGI
jgi:hypothetical protein